MIKLPEVSIIMSTYDGDILKNVESCINSIMAQSFKNFELVLIDDGITKIELKNYIHDLSDIDNRIRIFENEQNSGLAYSMNHAIRKSRGIFYARMDADDIMMPYRLEKQLEYLKANPNIDIIGSYYLEVNETENEINKVTLPLEHKEMVFSFPKRNPLAHVCVFMRKEFISKAGYYPLNTISDEDTMMWVEGIKNGARMANIPEYLVRVRVSNDFYKRRGGIKKALGDARNRWYVVKELHLPRYNIIYIVLRFLFQMNPFPKLTYWGYKYLRK